MLLIASVLISFLMALVLVGFARIGAESEMAPPSIRTGRTLKNQPLKN